MTSLFGQLRGGTMSLEGILIGVLVFIAVVAIAYIIITKAFGVTIPQWLIQVFWIVVAVAIGVIAIKFVLSLL